MFTGSLKLTLGMLAFVLLHSHCAAQNQEKLSLRVTTNDVVYRIDSTSITQKQIDEILAKVREFIWDHYRSKENGTLILHSVSKEGRMSMTKYESRQLSETKWGVFVKIERDVSGSGENAAMATDESKIVEFIVENIDRIDISKSVEKAIPWDIVCAGSSYRLRLKDSSGKILQEI